MLLVIIHDLNVVWSGRAFHPFEANPPLIVNPNAVSSLAIAFQRLQAVPRQLREVLAASRRFQSIQLQPRRALDSAKRLDALSGGEIPCPLVAIAENHPSVSSKLCVTSSITSGHQGFRFCS